MTFDLTHWDNEEVKISISRHDLRQVLKVVMEELQLAQTEMITDKREKALKNFIEIVGRVVGI